jgi:hypothetical protein
MNAEFAFELEALADAAEFSLSYIGQKARAPVRTEVREIGRRWLTGMKRTTITDCMHPKVLERNSLCDSFRIVDFIRRTWRVSTR